MTFRIQLRWTEHHSSYLKQLIALYLADFLLTAQTQRATLDTFLEEDNHVLVHFS